jgi:hypothetical protein
MQRYELIRLAQLIFSLLIMFGAFLGGLAVGWWRWGRPDAPVKPGERATTGQSGTRQPPVQASTQASSGGFRPEQRRPVSPELFTPAEPDPGSLDEGPAAVGAAFTPGPRELAPSVDPFQH